MVLRDSQKCSRVGLRVVSYSLFAATAVILMAHGYHSEPTSGSMPEAEDEKFANKKDEMGGTGQRHIGEEGKMGAVSGAKAKSGLYAMKGPKAAVPQSARSTRHSSGPGAAFSVGNVDQDVWGGLTGNEIGDAWGVGGLGLTGTGRGGGGTGEGTIGLGNSGLIGKGKVSGGAGYGRGSGPGFGGKGKRRPRVVMGRATIRGEAVAPKSREEIQREEEEQRQRKIKLELERVAQLEKQEALRKAFGDRWKAHVVDATQNANSTFSIDVDTASYTRTRSLLDGGRLPQPGEVRIEEFTNYFDYSYALPPVGQPVWAVSEVGPCPWNKNRKLVHIGVQADVIEAAETPPRNLVFLIDVSGSMHSAKRLPLLKQALTLLVSTLGDQDRVSIVVYAGAAGTVLPPTKGNNKDVILDALEELRTGGGTNGSEGIELAYELAAENFDDEGINRVIVATDGDFNLGVTGRDGLVDLISAKRELGIYLSVLGFGVGSRQDGTMEQLADRGNGNYAYIDRLSEAQRLLVEQAGGTLVPVADDVKIQVEFDSNLVRSHRLVGYHNRRLAHRDFADDTKDAGEIGSGHTVTALYEIELSEEAQPNAELMTLGLRYKDPGEHQSELWQTNVVNRDISLSATSHTFRFSAAVAEVGQILSGYQLPDGGWPQAIRRAENARSEDPRCDRAGFVDLAKKAAAISGYAEYDSAPKTECTTGSAVPRERGQQDVGEQVEMAVSEFSKLGSLTLYDMLSATFGLLIGVLQAIPLWLSVFPAMFGGLLLGGRRLRK